eukprot:TRINITY_DN8141_c0_g1_i1.p1 TRINITY_DN8141_c0_g1~~TRINITY_DN8141_c0_g1_i1.p1  ORF type:complete len:108 (-),score=15.13 TRINITY_DN8141_c0_g1_i1:9-332(-)
MESTFRGPRLYHFQPGEVKVIPEGFRPVKAECSIHQTALISQDGKCIVFGTHRLHQKEGDEHPMTLNHIKIAPEVPLDSIAMGWAHYLMLTRPLSSEIQQECKSSSV